MQFLKNTRKNITIFFLKKTNTVKEDKKYNAGLGKSP